MSQEKEKKGDSLQTLREDVENAKRDLLRIAEETDPLGGFRKHPVATVGVALAGGLFVGLLRPLKLAPFLPVALEATELLLKRANSRYD